MSDLIHIKNLFKTYDNGFSALKDVNLVVRDAEIIALLGPNGAGKTTLISIICGIVNPTSGTVTVDGFDIIKHYRQTRSRIGLVPQELHTEAFESVIATVNFSRGLFGKKPNPEYIEKILKQLSLWDKKDAPIRALSGGMKRRLLIAKALSHEPKILFLDEPSAGVDVELRKDMWQLVEQLRQEGVTIILTTHYIEEAEEIADRIAIINQGEIKLVEDKKELMRKLGKKQLSIQLLNKLETIPPSLSTFHLNIIDDGFGLRYEYNESHDHSHISDLLTALKESQIVFKDIATQQSSLEDIFVDLIKDSSL